MFFSLQGYKVIGFDTETTGLRYPVDRAFGFSVATPEGKRAYFDIRRTPKAIDWLSDELARFEGTIAAHNASFDIRMAMAAGIKIPLEKMDCTCVRACCIDEHLRQYDLDYLGQKYLMQRKAGDIYDDLAKLFGGKATKSIQMKNLYRAPPEVVAPYAKQDAWLTMQLWLFQEKEIERQGIRAIMDYERKLLPTFARAEMRGIRIDTQYAEEAAEKITPIIARKEAELDAIAGKPVNAKSPKQVLEIMQPRRQGDFWVALDGTPLETTPKGAPSLRSYTLQQIQHPAAKLVTEIRSLYKTRDTFLLGHVIGHSYNGRVYPHINQVKGEDGGTGTGRLSYTNPAMQQIPNRNQEVAAIVKPAFLPEEGHIWLDCDKASFEVRTFFHLVNNPEIVEAYTKEPEMDMHQWVADVTGLPRNARPEGGPYAKQLNLAMLYNQGNGSTAVQMGMPWEWAEFTDRDGKTVRYRKAGPEAVKVIEDYHRRFPGIRELIQRCTDVAKEYGYVKTYTGRRLRFPNKRLAYQAVAKLSQATAAEINKENWLIIEKELEGVGHLILNTHDSYSLSLPPDWQEHYKRIKSKIERPLLRVPLVLDFTGVGPNWWEAVRKDK